MRLSDLQPNWIENGGRRVCFVMKCPHCVAKGVAKPTLLSCAIVPWKDAFPKVSEEHDFFDALLPSLGYEDYGRCDLIGCKPTIAWTIKSAESFETISVTPSLDASNSGHWHGFITNGNIVGGI